MYTPRPFASRFPIENFATRDPVNLLNVRGGVTAGGGWKLTVWARNLTNKDSASDRGARSNAVSM